MADFEGDTRFEAQGEVGGPGVGNGVARGVDTGGAKQGFAGFKAGKAATQGLFDDSFDFDPGGSGLLVEPLVPGVMAGALKSVTVGQRGEDEDERKCRDPGAFPKDNGSECQKRTDDGRKWHPAIWQVIGNEDADNGGQGHRQQRARFA